MAVNTVILADMPVVSAVMDLETARAEGAMALFGEKYGDRVRTIKVGESDECFSYELCGGTHVTHTSHIGPFIITGEESVAAGVRRIEAVTGRGALAMMSERFQLLQGAAEMLGTTPADLQQRLRTLQNNLKADKRLLGQMRAKLAHVEFERLLETKVQQVADIPVLAAEVGEANVDTLRQMADWFRDRQESGVMVLGTVTDGKPHLVAAVTGDLVKEGIKAGDIIKHLAKVVGGGGGGRPTFATAGGRDPGKLPEALAQVPALVKAAAKER